jgi:hypothetical protein
MHYYLIVSEGDHERVLCEGSKDDLEALAKKLRASKRFRYVRVDQSAPSAGRRHAPNGEGQATRENDSGSAST